MAEEKRTAVRWLQPARAQGYNASPGDVELLPVSTARTLVEAGYVELAAKDDKAPERRVTRQRETR